MQIEQCIFVNWLCSWFWAYRIKWKRSMGSSRADRSIKRAFAGDRKQVFEHKHWFCWLQWSKRDWVSQVLFDCLHVYKCYKPSSGCNFIGKFGNFEIRTWKTVESKSTRKLSLLERVIGKEGKSRFWKSLCNFTCLHWKWSCEQIGFKINDGHG